MSNRSTAVILGQGTNLSTWVISLKATLISKGCLGHVIHDQGGIRANLKPQEPDLELTPLDERDSVMKAYEDALEEWTLREIIALDIVAQRISKEIRPRYFHRMTAKRLFEHACQSREAGVMTPWETAMRNLHRTKLTSTVENYCNEFLRNYIDVNCAAEMIADNSKDDEVDKAASYKIPPGVASYMFVMGTLEVDWLDTWRQTRVYETDSKYASLAVLMSTMRQLDRSRNGVFHGKAAMG